MVEVFLWKNLWKFFMEKLIKICGKKPLPAPSSQRWFPNRKDISY